MLIYVIKDGQEIIIIKLKLLNNVEAILSDSGTTVTMSYREKSPNCS